MSDETVKLFISAGCGPCEQVRKMVEEGKFNLDQVDIIDVASDEGYPYIEKLGLQKVPMAMKGTKVCPIYMDDESLFIDCGENPPAEETQ